MKKKLCLLFLALLPTLLTSCAQHRWLEVQAGTYIQIQKGDEATGALQEMTIDREANTVVLAFETDLTTTLPFTAREREQWPSGCPTNLFHHYLEVLDLDIDTVTFGDLVLQDPILVRNCPEEPEQVILREDGRIGGGGDATAEPYLIFTPTARLANSQSETLPHSLKGYELYSWQVRDGNWEYTLVTATNREKTAEELVTDEDMLTEEGWVKQTVMGAEALLDLLDRLPSGEQIMWRGALAAPAGADQHQFRLPEETVVATVEERCRELGLELILIANELEAVLALPQIVTAGEPVNLSFTLLNHADYPLYVLKWYTPLEGIAGEIFHITRNGQALPYEGILAMRGDPGPENYVLLPPGGSVTATVDLTQAYDFTEPGTYTITFLSPLISDTAQTENDMAHTVEDLGPVPMLSYPVSVTVVASSR